MHIGYARTVRCMDVVSSKMPLGRDVLASTKIAVRIEDGVGVVALQPCEKCYGVVGVGVRRATIGFCSKGAMVVAIVLWVAAAAHHPFFFPYPFDNCTFRANNQSDSVQVPLPQRWLSS